MAHEGPFTACLKGMAGKIVQSQPRACLKIRPDSAARF